MKKWTIIVLLSILALMIAVIINIILGCDNLLGPDELEPNADGVYTFHPEDMPQVVFIYNSQTWLMTAENRASPSVKIRIRSHYENSTGRGFTLKSFCSYSYTEYYKIGKCIEITIWRDGITTTFTVKLG